MNSDTTKAVVAFIGLTLVSGIAIAESVHIHRIEKKKRQKIQENFEKDLETLHQLGEEMQTRIMRGDYDGKFSQMFDDFQTNVDFGFIVNRIED